MKVSVLGNGNWGTTFAQVLADAGHDVVIWGRDELLSKRITVSHVNDAYLPGIRLPDSVTATCDLHEAISGVDAIVVALPSQVARSVLEQIKGSIDDSTLMVSLMKGVELGTLQRMSQVIVEACGVSPEQVAVISGPNLAAEIALRQPAATVVAANTIEVAQQAAQLCATSYFRPYTNVDVVGVELCGAVKNVIALAVGIAQGSGSGDNTKATMITRGLVETARLGVALGADSATFSGLAGMGDLVATCASPLSRNRRLGALLGGGMTLQDAITVTGQTAEGVESCLSILELAQSVDVEMPITAAVVSILYQGMPVELMASLLLNRPYRSEGL